MKCFVLGIRYLILSIELLAFRIKYRAFTKEKEREREGGRRREGQRQRQRMRE